MHLGVTLAQAPANPGFDYVGPIAGTGIVGVFLLLVILRIKIMPTYVFDDAKKEWERERASIDADHARERDGLEKDVEELKSALREANVVYTTQVIPTLTRALDAERELVDLRREEQRDREQRRRERE